MALLRQSKLGRVGILVFLLLPAIVAGTLLSALLHRDIITRASGVTGAVVLSPFVYLLSHIIPFSGTQSNLAFWAGVSIWSSDLCGTAYVVIGSNWALWVALLLALLGNLNSVLIFAGMMSI